MIHPNQILFLFFPFVATSILIMLLGVTTLKLIQLPWDLHLVAYLESWTSIVANHHYICIALSEAKLQSFLSFLRIQVESR